MPERWACCTLMNVKTVEPSDIWGEKDTLVEAAKFVDQNTTADIIDINMGCPVPKITKCDAGAKWLLDPNKIYEMVSAVVDAVDKPVTVKMRMGWDEDHIFAIENARAVERAGGQAVALHGRTRVQMYEGTANWDIIKRSNNLFPFQSSAMEMSKPLRMQNVCLMKRVQMLS